MKHTHTVTEMICDGSKAIPQESLKSFVMIQMINYDNHHAPKS